MHTKWNNFNLVCMFLCFSGVFFDYLHTKVEKIKFGMYLFLIYWLNSVKNTYHFLIKQIGMYKGNFLREFWSNFTYQFEKMHFGMYILDCHVASLHAIDGKGWIATIFLRKSRNDVEKTDFHAYLFFYLI